MSKERFFPIPVAEAEKILNQMIAERQRLNLKEKEYQDKYMPEKHLSAPVLSGGNVPTGSYRK